MAILKAASNFSLAYSLIALQTYVLRHIIHAPHNTQLSWASWRLFTLACAVPSLMVTVTFVFMPESPKFLVCQVWCPLYSHARYLQLHTVSGAARGGPGAAADDLQHQHPGQRGALQGGQPRAGGLLHRPAAEPGPRTSYAESKAHSYISYIL